MPVNRLLVATAVVYAGLGLPLLFASDEVLAAAGLPGAASAWVGGLLGSALAAMALLHWFQRHTLTGGIYGRPLVLANLLLLSNATFSSLREWRATSRTAYAVVAVLAGALLVVFFRQLFTSPAGVQARGATPAP